MVQTKFDISKYFKVWCCK